MKGSRRTMELVLKKRRGRLRPRRARARAKVSDWRVDNKASSKKG
jgi:hypothetical protein